MGQRRQAQDRGAIMRQRGWTWDRGVHCGTERGVVGQGAPSQDEGGGHGMEGSITGWRRPSQDGGDNRGMEGTAVGHCADSPFGGREPVHPTGGEPAGCQRLAEPGAGHPLLPAKFQWALGPGPLCPAPPRPL